MQKEVNLLNKDQDNQRTDDNQHPMKYQQFVLTFPSIPCQRPQEPSSVQSKTSGVPSSSRSKTPSTKSGPGQRPPGGPSQVRSKPPQGTKLPVQSKTSVISSGSRSRPPEYQVQVLVKDHLEDQRTAAISST